MTPGAAPLSPGYTVKLEVFEGPLDLLLHLIRREEMDIYDIPISLITQQYLDSLEGLASLDLDRASEFLVMAATLMDIKSRMLLPRPAAPEYISAEDVADPRQELVKRLLEYKRYKEAASFLSEKAALARRRHSRFGGAWGVGPAAEPRGAGCAGAGSGTEPGAGAGAGGVAGPDGGEEGFGQAGMARPAGADAAEGPGAGRVSLTDLVTALMEVLANLEERPLTEISRETLTVADKIEELVPLLEEAGEKGAEFVAILRREKSRRAAVVVFLALLELLRQGRVKAVQERPFGPIMVWASANLADWGWPGRD